MRLVDCVAIDDKRHSLLSFISLPYGLAVGVATPSFQVQMVVMKAISQLLSIGGSSDVGVDVAVDAKNGKAYRAGG